jgi:hypothetical protein
VSTCLRAGGGAGLVGVLGPLEHRSSAIDLFEADDGGWRRVGRATLGILDVCPSVASNDAGMTVVAGAIRGRLRHVPIRASVRLPGGSFEAPVTIATANGQTASGVATAVSARGDLLVAWAQVRRVTRRTSGQVRVVAVRRSAGGAFGELEALSPWRRQGASGTAEVVAAFDADGDATVVLTRGTRSKGPVQNLTTTEVFSAPAGAGFSEPQTLTRRLQDTTTPALAVAPDGRALVAVDGVRGISLFERAPGTTAFTSLPGIRAVASASSPTLAMRADGAAVLSWRAQATGIAAMVRSAPGPFANRLTVARARQLDADGGGLVFAIGRDEPAFPPYDFDEDLLRVGLAEDGSFVIGWHARRRLAFADTPVALRAAYGTLNGSLTLPRSLGSPARSSHGAAAVLLRDGSPALALVDNAGALPIDEDASTEVPSGRGRLHLFSPAGRSPVPHPPRLSLTVPRRKSLRHGEALRVRVRCGTACDLRGVVRGPRNRGFFNEGSGRRGLGSTSLPGGRAGILRIEPGEIGHLASKRPGGDTVVVRACHPSGLACAVKTRRLDLRRRRVRPLPTLLSVRARLRGRTLTVRWHTDRSATGTDFVIEGRPTRRGHTRRFHLFANVEGRAKQSYRARLRLQRGDRVRFVAVTILSRRVPDQSRTVVVPVMNRR